jgi:hypothetical protein
MFMPKQPVSVTLEETNILWLKGRARGGGYRSMSEVLDELITAGRKQRYAGDVRSVAGTIDIAETDPLLERADAAIRDEFAASLSRPLLVQAPRGPSRETRRPPGKLRHG